eukprot:220027_1
MNPTKRDKRKGLNLLFIFLVLILIKFSYIVNQYNTDIFTFTYSILFSLYPMSFTNHKYTQKLNIGGSNVIFGELPRPKKRKTNHISHYYNKVSNDNHNSYNYNSYDFSSCFINEITTDNIQPNTTTTRKSEPFKQNNYQTEINKGFFSETKIDDIEEDDLLQDQNVTMDDTFNTNDIDMEPLLFETDAINFTSLAQAIE